MSHLFRHLLIVAAALPMLLGILASAHTTPCLHGHESAQGEMDCPCCDKPMIATAVPCVACVVAVEAREDGPRSRRDATRIAFAPRDHRSQGREIEPPLPPPRPLGSA